MSRQINLPINQVRLTNVAVVRMNRGGKRFEIACYRNKVVNYRQGLETDLSEVLQTDRIFTNVSKGQFANRKDLVKIFETADEEAIAMIILEKGTLQVSDKEREQQLENTLREVATWVAHNCVHPETQRPYTTTQIREAMRQAEFASHSTRSIKRQYLDCVKLLQAKNVLPIERAKMELALYSPIDNESQVQEALNELKIVASQVSNASTEECRVLLVDPSLFRPLDELAKTVGGRLEIIQQVVQQEGDNNLELELERRKQKETDDSLATRLQESLQLHPEEENVDLIRAAERVENNDDSAEELRETMNQSARKNQKKAQKKSKKAKRREKEEAAERQARIDAERQRQEERAAQTAPWAGADSTSQQEQSDTKSCNTCGGSFTSAATYRAHFRSDWHRYNIKLKMKGVVPVSEEEFRLCDADAFFDNM